MEKSIKIGSLVLYTHIDHEYTEVWSGFVTNLYTKDKVNYASIDIDGIVVPPMKRCGILGPLPWKNSIECHLTDLSLRKKQHDDDIKRQNWFTKVADYQEAQEALEKAKFNAKKQRFSHIKPGMPVTWSHSKKGVIKEVKPNILYAIVVDNDRPDIQVSIDLDDLTFI